MLEREDDELADGTGMHLVKALLALNKYKDPNDPKPLVEVVVMSRNSPETGVRVFQLIFALGNFRSVDTRLQVVSRWSPT